MSQTYTISPLAYTKLVLHALKHPHTPANGVLLGARTPDGAIAVTDAVPLLHHWTSLSPMMEVGLELARGHADARSLDLVGYYQAAAHAHDAVLAPVGERVAATLRASFPDALALVIDGSKLDAADMHALIPFLPSSPAPNAPWRPVPSPITALSVPPALPALTLRIARENGLQRLLGDFDDHLEDVSVDWLGNPQVAAFLAERGES